MRGFQEHQGFLILSGFDLPHTDLSHLRLTASVISWSNFDIYFFFGAFYAPPKIFADAALSFPHPPPPGGPY